MEMIKMKVTGGEAKEYSAARILSHVNESESVIGLQDLNWGSDKGKIDFLTGKSSATHAIVETPMTEESAKTAVAEYKEFMGLTN